MNGTKFKDLSFDTKIITYLASADENEVSRIVAHCKFSSYRLVLSTLVREEAINKLAGLLRRNSGETTKLVDKIIKRFKMKLKKHGNRDLKNGRDIRKAYRKGPEFRKDAEIIAHLRRMRVEVVYSTDRVFVTVAKNEGINAQFLDL